MDTFHTEYRALSAEESKAVIDIKEKASELEALLAVIATPNTDMRCLSIARTNLEQTVMWAVKSITK